MTVDNTLKLSPFNLSDDDLAWVRKTRDGLSTENKVRQLFVHISMGDDPALISQIGRDEARRTAPLHGP